MEQWRPVVGYEGLYEVSDHGRVRSLDRLVVCVTGVQRVIPGRLMRFKPPIKKYNPYYQVGLTRDGKQKYYAIHVLVLSAFVGPRPSNLMWGRHLDGSPLNNHASNLAWGTAKENSADSIRHGTRPRGESVVYSKLTDEAVREIRALRRRGLTYKSISDRYGMSISAIESVTSARTWKHVR